MERGRNISHSFYQQTDTLVFITCPPVSEAGHTAGSVSSSYLALLL